MLSNKLEAKMSFELPAQSKATPPTKQVLIQQVSGQDILIKHKTVGQSWAGSDMGTKGTKTGRNGRVS